VLPRESRKLVLRDVAHADDISAIDSEAAAEVGHFAGVTGGEHQDEHGRFLVRATLRLEALSGQLRAFSFE
jgi:hypothetical protein